MLIFSGVGIHWNDRSYLGGMEREREREVEYQSVIERTRERGWMTKWEREGESERGRKESIKVNE